MIPIAYSSREACPIFCISSVTGEGLPLLRSFLHCLPSRLQEPFQSPSGLKPTNELPTKTCNRQAILHTSCRAGAVSIKLEPENSVDADILFYRTSKYKKIKDLTYITYKIINKLYKTIKKIGIRYTYISHLSFQDSGLFRAPNSPAEFHIDSIYVVPGVGLVVGGIVRGGRLRPGQQLLLGPDKVSGFKPVLVALALLDLGGPLCLLHIVLKLLYLLIIYVFIIYMLRLFYLIV